MASIPQTSYDLFNTTPEALLERFKKKGVGMQCYARCRVTARNTSCSGNMRRVNLLCGVITLNWRTEEENAALLFLD